MQRGGGVSRFGDPNKLSTKIATAIMARAQISSKQPPSITTKSARSGRTKASINARVKIKEGRRY